MAVLQNYQLKGTSDNDCNNPITPRLPFKIHFRGDNVAELKRVNVRIRPKLYDVLKAKAEERGLSMNAMYILALESYIQQLVVTDNLEDLIKANEELNKNK